MAHAVFPLLPNTKRPAIADWENRATTHPDPTKWRHDQGTGIACGPSGIIVVDLDIPHGPTSWFNLINGIGRATSTYTTETPSGGLHLYYDNSDGLAIRNSAGKLGTGIDIRAQGGYVVQYDPIIDIEPAPIPQWLAKLLVTRPPRQLPRHRSQPRTNSPRYGDRALQEECNRVATAPEGTRNHALNHAAFRIGQLIGGGEQDETHARTELETAAHLAGLSGTEVTKTINSGIESGKANPRTRR